MSTAKLKAGDFRREPLEEVRVSSYDSVASLLIALLILLGATVLILFSVWMSNRLARPVRSVPVELHDFGEGEGGGHPEGEGTEGVELEGVEGAVIGIPADLISSPVQNRLAAVAKTVELYEGVIDTTYPDDIDLPPGAGGRSRGTGRKVALGSGSGRPGGVPRFNRWEVRFPEGNTLDDYARQIDFFHIELAAVGGGKEIEYVSNLSQATPTKRVGQPEQEKRLYMTWRNGTLKNADQQLMARAGVDTKGKLILQFYPPETERLLLTIENAFKGRKPEQIRKTVFEIQPDGQGYKFVVLDQIPI